jgi:hypothetical protein
MKMGPRQIPKGVCAAGCSKSKKGATKLLLHTGYLKARDGDENEKLS